MATKLITPSPPQARLLTVEEWVQRPDADRYELIDGVLRLRVVNENRHEYAVIRLGYVLSDILERTGITGEVFGSNTKYRIRPRRGIMPDVSVVLGTRTDQIEPRAASNTVGPDLAVEILSPDQDAAYVEERLDDYWKLGTQEVWIVDPGAETVTGYAREAREFVVFAEARRDEEFSSRLLDGLSFSVRKLWMRRGWPLIAQGPSIRPLEARAHPGAGQTEELKHDSQGNAAAAGAASYGGRVGPAPRCGSI